MSLPYSFKFSLLFEFCDDEFCYLLLTSLLVSGIRSDFSNSRGSSKNFENPWFDEYFRRQVLNCYIHTPSIADLGVSEIYSGSNFLVDCLTDQ